MKPVLILLALALGGCAGTYVPVAGVNMAIKLCEPNGGLYSVYAEDRGRDKIRVTGHCMNNAQFVFLASAR